MYGKDPTFHVSGAKIQYMVAAHGRRYTGGAVCVRANSSFTDSRKSATIVKTLRIVPNGMKRHSMQAITSANE